jgi:hypothetical protein
VFEVIGIVGDVRSTNISRVDPAFVYLPTDSTRLRDYLALVRISGDTRKAIAAIRTTLEQTDGQLRPGFSLVSLVWRYSRFPSHSSNDEYFMPFAKTRACS